jgi:hydrogenase maturation protease
VTLRTIVIGVGNPILSNDGFGLHVAKELQQKIADPDVVVETAFTGGFNLVDMMCGFDRAILIDTVHLKNAKNGEVKRFTIADLPLAHSSNPHEVSFPEALRLAKTLRETRLPSEIIIVGMVSHITPAFGEQMSKEFAPNVSTAVHMVLSELAEVKP